MTFWIRLLTLVILIALHLSSVQIITAHTFPPVVLIASTIALTVILGFPQSLLPILFLIVATESITSGRIPFSATYFILAAYTTSFVMKRTLIGDRTGLSFFMLAAFAGGVSMGFPIFQELLWWFGLQESFLSLWYWFSWGTLATTWLSGFCAYLFIFWALNACEKVIQDIRQDAQFSLR